MATINFTRSKDLVKTATFTWETLTASDVGQALEYSKYNDKTVTVTGTFNSGTVTIQGSNDNTNWFTLTDNLGLPLTFTAAGIKLIAENPTFIRPSADASITDVDVIIEAVRS